MMYSRKFLFVIITMLSMAVPSFWLFFGSNVRLTVFDVVQLTSVSSSRLISQLSAALAVPRTRRNNNRTKTILFSGHSVWLDVARFQIELQHPLCGFRNCKFTKDADLLPTADAVLWHQHNVGQIYDPNFKRPAHQKWIYFNLESPAAGTTDHVMFDWSMTYMTDSTIPTPYWLWIPKQDLLQHSSLTDYLLDGFTQMDDPSITGYRNLPVYRKTSVLRNNAKDFRLPIVTSRCSRDPKTMRLRDKYMLELEKYVDIDKYGCNISCSGLIEGSTGDVCFQYISRNYKFYLAMENAVCDEYITEKLYYAYKMWVVPIVFGGSRKDYQQLAPPNSFIHVNDFASAQELASYLRLLHNNDTLYESYFDWRRQGVLITGDQTLPFCRLCMLLNTGAERMSRQDDLKKQFNKNQCRSDWRE